MADDSLVPNPKLRRSGAVLVLLAVLCYLGTATGFDAHGTTGRVVLAVVGTVLLVFAVLLLRSKVPGISGLSADERGLTVQLGGVRTESVPWSDIDSVWLKQLSPIFGGTMLTFVYAAGATPRPGLRAFERRLPDGTMRVLLGLNAAQGEAMRRALPAAAGPRLRAAGG